MVKLNIYLSRPVRVKAGQYINLWIPSVSFWSFLQSHPFVVTSWAEEGQKCLQLVIEPRRGLTRQLLRHAKTDTKDLSKYRFMVFSGPHGMSAAVDDYEVMLMIADGFGVAALLPYLKKLLYGYKGRTARTRRIHLVWQIHDIGKSCTG